MAKAKAKPYPPPLLELMASTTAILLKARTFADMGMAETSQPMWTAAASYEERIAPLLDALGRTLEATASRISAASSYQIGIHSPGPRPLCSSTIRPRWREKRSLIQSPNWPGPEGFFVAVAKSSRFGKLVTLYGERLD